MKNFDAERFEQLSKLSFDAYFKVIGPESMSHRFPQWDNLTPKIKAAWIESTKAIVFELGLITLPAEQDKQPDALPFTRFMPTPKPEHSVCSRCGRYNCQENEK